MLDQFNGAVMNEDRTHRFLLWRTWDERQCMTFIGLNPSTANEVKDDPTIRRLVQFAQKLGHGGLYVVNLFSMVTPYPADLVDGKRSHPANDHAIQMAVNLVDRVVCGWGDLVEKVHGGKDFADGVVETIPLPMCFGITNKGNPRHPLYLRGDTELEPL